MLDTTDLCVGFFDRVWEGGHLDFPPSAHVLEVGCADADWIGAVKKVRPDVTITGIDWRGGVTRPAAFEVVHGDVLAVDWPLASFDCIAAISTVEHIGLGAYEKDPIDADGDTHAMVRMAGWLKPGGWLYLDVPYRPKSPYKVRKNFRIYDLAQLTARLITPTELRLRHSQMFEDSHPDSPYMALVLEKNVA